MPALVKSLQATLFLGTFLVIFCTAEALFVVNSKKSYMELSEQKRNCRVTAIGKTIKEKIRKGFGGVSKKIIGLTRIVECYFDL